MYESPYNKVLSSRPRPDTKLPYKQRMRKVEMNKKEGNELVKDGASWFWGGLNVT